MAYGSSELQMEFDSFSWQDVEILFYLLYFISNQVHDGMREYISVFIFEIVFDLRERWYDYTCSTYF